MSIKIQHKKPKKPASRGAYNGDSLSDLHGHSLRLSDLPVKYDLKLEHGGVHARTCISPHGSLALVAIGMRIHRHVA
jgi:hypothetical protein